jgi:hypothetical protein
MNKKGISAIIVTLILISISLIIGVIVWNVVNSLVKEKLNEADSCFNVFEKVQLNRQYTCYKSSGEVWVSINIGGEDVESVIVSIFAKGEGKSFTITNEETQIPFVANYKSTLFGEDLIKLPGKDSGATYIYNWGESLLEGPDSIQVVPIIGGNQCGVADTVSSFDICETID